MRKLQLLFILFHISLFLILYSTNLIVLHISDDSSLYTLLKAGYSGTLILSYPTSWVLSNLYQWFPSIQWLSLFYFTLVFINLIIFYYYKIKNTEKLFSRSLLILFSIILYTYIWQNISITILTLLTYVSAIMLYRYNVKVAFFFIFLSLFLRIDIAILCLPFIILSMILLNYSTLTKWKNLLLLFVAILVPIYLNSYLIKKDVSYEQWAQFNSARGFFHDLHGNFNKTNFTDNQVSLLKGWWVQDESLLSSKQVISNQYSLMNLYIEQLTNFDIKKLLNHKYRFTILLLFLIGLIAFYKKNRILTFGYMGFVLGVGLVLIIRDVDRVVIPLLFLWFILILQMINKNEIKNLFILIFLILFFLSFPIKYNQSSEQDISEKKEGMQLLMSMKMKCEPSINFPQSFAEGYKLFMLNFIFDESNWIGTEHNVLRAGWLSRHPYFYESHNITGLGEERKFNNFYDWLISDESCFFGGKEIIIKKEIFNLYDNKLENNNCRHKIKILKENEKLAITKIYLECNEENQ